MRKLLAVFACLIVVCAAAVAAPEKKAAKKSGQDSCGACPMSSQKADCPMTHAKDGAKSSECGQCPMSGKADKAGAKLTTVRCGEGTHKIDVAKATAQKRFVDHGGKRYYFACERCPSEYKKDPAKYVARHQGFPIPKAGKAATTR